MFVQNDDLGKCSCAPQCDVDPCPEPPAEGEEADTDATQILMYYAPQVNDDGVYIGG